MIASSKLHQSWVRRTCVRDSEIDEKHVTRATWRVGHSRSQHCVIMSRGFRPVGGSKLMSRLDNTIYHVTSLAITKLRGHVHPNCSTRSTASKNEIERENASQQCACSSPRSQYFALFSNVTVVFRKMYRSRDTRLCSENTCASTLNVIYPRTMSWYLAAEATVERSVYCVNISTLLLKHA